MYTFYANTKLRRKNLSIHISIFPGVERCGRFWNQFSQGYPGMTVPTLRGCCNLFLIPLDLESQIKCLLALFCFVLRHSFTTQPKLSLNSQSSCLRLSGPGINVCSPCLLSNSVRKKLCKSDQECILRR